MIDGLIAIVGERRWSSIDGDATSSDPKCLSAAMAARAEMCPTCDPAPGDSARCCCTASNPTTSKVLQKMFERFWQIVFTTSNYFYAIAYFHCRRYSKKVKIV